LNVTLISFSSTRKSLTAALMPCAFRTASMISERATSRPAGGFTHARFSAAREPRGLRLAVERALMVQRDAGHCEEQRIEKLTIDRYVWSTRDQWAIARLT
jgi:hypothetical protein